MKQPSFLPTAFALGGLVIMLAGLQPDATALELTWRQRMTGLKLGKQARFYASILNRVRLNSRA